MTPGTKAINSLLYITPDAERRDLEALRQWILPFQGRKPDLQTDIGKEVAARIMAVIDSEMVAIHVHWLQDAEKHLTMF